MFYAAIQRGLDFWNGAFFCGSAALIRRKALESVGGLASSTITEDAETACELHARLAQPLCRPADGGRTFARIRLPPPALPLGAGHDQLLIKNPLMYGRLGFAQRLAPVELCPLLDLPGHPLHLPWRRCSTIWFSLEIFEASLNEFLAFALPHLVTTALLANYTFGRLRMPFQSDVYEMLGTVPDAGHRLGRAEPAQATFKVTPKGGAAEGDYVSEHIWPVAGLMGVILATQLFGMYRFVTYPAGTAAPHHRP